MYTSTVSNETERKGEQDLQPQQIQALQHSFLFAGLPPEQARQLACWGEVQRFADGQVIYSACRFRRAIGLLLEGGAQIYSPSGAPLNTLGPGACFGAAALFNPSQRYVSQIVALGQTAVAFYTDSQLEQMFSLNPRMARNYIAFLSQRIQFLNDKISSFTTPTAQARAARWLLQRGPEIQVPSYTRLAGELNLGRASLYRALDALESQGCLRRQGNQITLLNQAALEQAARPHITKEEP